MDEERMKDIESKRERRFAAKSSSEESTVIVLLAAIAFRYGLS